MSRTCWIFLGIIVFAVVIVAASILLSQQMSPAGCMTVERPDVTICVDRTAGRTVGAQRRRRLQRRRLHGRRRAH